MVPKFSTLIYNKVKFIKSDYGYHSSFLSIFDFHHVITQILLSIFRVHPAATQILLSLSISIFHHVATKNPGDYCQLQISPCSNSDPGHGTKFVTLTSFIFLYKCYVKTGPMCLQISYSQLMWLVLLPLCGHK